jgi:uncharacterized protein (TIGR02145 family)
MKQTDKVLFAILMVGLIFSFSYKTIAQTSEDKSNPQSKKKSTEQVNSNYDSVKIGAQTWMTENLNIDHYRNGDPIPEVQDSVQWKNLKTGAWCYYNNDPENGKKYGKLYNWYAVNDTRGLAPEGWHVPTKAEFNTLDLTVKGNGNALKVLGQGTGSGAGTNTSGFSALLAGYRDYTNGGFLGLGGYTDFWSSTENDTYIAYYLRLSSNASDIYLYDYGKVFGFSVRCVRGVLYIPASYSQNPCPNDTTVDYAGKTYNTVTIGDQCWLKENLDVGTMINSINGGTNGDGNQTNNGTIEKYCYNDDPANCTKYGGLYQWNEAMQYVTTEGAQGICPTGWHIPTYAEFQTLSSTVSNDGNALKAVGQGTGSGVGTNTSGFSALLSGYRIRDGYFTIISKGYGTPFWSAEEKFATDATVMFLYFNDSKLDFNVFDKGKGFGVRCVKD